MNSLPLILISLVSLPVFSFAQNSSAKHKLVTYLKSKQGIQDIKKIIYDKSPDYAHFVPFTGEDKRSTADDLLVSVMDDSDLIFYTRSCFYFSTSILWALARKFPGTTFCQNSGTISPREKVEHFFLSAFDHELPAEGLLIDPTYLQFIVTEEKIPILTKELSPIFVGEYTDLENLLTIYKPNMSDITVNDYKNAKRGRCVSVKP